MRPIKLTMSAFCSYQNTETIDFTTIGNGGTYLITGDTGAGKTTIFDAITYALYGQPSGNDRSANMLRNTSADPSKETYVELEFEHMGKTYKVRRKPEYMRKKQRGEGLTADKATLELTMPDGKVISDVRRGNDEIEGIIGLSREQFQEIVMLAQGEFEKFLVCGTDEKNGIFRKLFATQKFVDFTDKLKGLLSAKSDEKKQADAKMSQIRSQIRCAEGDPLQPNAEKAKKGELPVADTLALIEGLIDSGKSKLMEKKEEQKKEQSKLDELNKAIGAAKKTEKDKADLASQSKRLEEVLKPGLDNAGKALDAAKTSLQGKDDLLRQAESIKTKIPEYQKLDDAKSSRVKSVSKMEDLKKAIAKDRQDKTDADSEIEKYKKVIENLKDCEVRKANLEKEKDNVNRKISDIEDLKKKLDILSNSRKDMDKASGLEKSALTAYEAATANHSRVLESYHLYTAGELADCLKENEPCPVCGSISHPKPAIRPEGTVTKADLDEAYRKMDEAQKKYEKAGKALAEAKAKVEANQTTVTELASKVIGTENLDEIPAKLQAHDVEARKRLSGLISDIATETRNIRTKADSDAKVKSLEEKSQKLSVAIAAGEKDFAVENKTAENLSATISELSAKLTEYPDAKAATKAMEGLNGKAKMLQDSYDKAIEAYDKAKSDHDNCKGQIDSLKKTISEAVTLDLAELTGQAKAQNEKIAGINDEISAIQADLSANSGAKDELAKGEERLGKIEKDYAMLDNLYRTSSGNLSGKAKINFETYVQMAYFDRVLGYANRRFLQMSNGQYELVRASEAASNGSKSGLDINIIDHYDGKERQAKSMSGGEKFMASLSLALGLSDEIQASAGGVQVDAMFVDEGFGTLDDAYLDRACKALNDLAENNTIVGVISHIKALEDRIPRHLEVTKDNSGSHAKFNV
jgi:exonuclease SbcC